MRDNTTEVIFMKNKEIVLLVVILSLIVLTIFYNIYLNQNFKDLKKDYWNQLALTNNLAERLNYSDIGGGRGTIHWNYSDKTATSNYIECAVNFEEQSFNNCKEGVVIWGSPFDSNTIKWIAIK